MPSCGRAAGAAGLKLSLHPQGALAGTQTSRHFFCRNLLQSAEAEAEEQPKQHGVT